MPLILNSTTSSGGASGIDLGGQWTYLGTTAGAVTLNYTVTTTSNTTLISCWLPAGGSPGYDCPVPAQYWQPGFWAGSQWDAPPSALTEEQRARDRRLAEEVRANSRRYAEESAARQRARGRARDRAMELLMSVLTAEQAHAYVRDGWFETRGSDGGLFRVYRRGQQGNVREIIGGQEVASYCCHPPGGLPDADAHLAQLLHLETDERGFRRTANRTALWQPATA